MTRSLEAQGFGPSPSARFLRPETVLYDSVNAPRDLGDIETILAEIKGFIGDQAGKASIFLRFRLTRPSNIQLRLLPVNRFTDRFLQVALLDARRRSIRLDEDGFARGVEISNTEISESFLRPPSGEYFVVVTTTQWNSTPYRLSFGVAGAVLLTSRLAGRGLLSRSSLPPSVVLAGAFAGGGEITTTGIVGRSIIALRGIATGDGGLANSTSPVQGGVARFWLSRITSPIETTGGSREAATAIDADGNTVTFFRYRAPGQSQSRLGITKHAASGAVLWSRLSVPFINTLTDFNAVRIITSLPNGDVIFLTNRGGLLGLDLGTIGRLSRDGEILWLNRYTTTFNTNPTPGVNRLVYDPGSDRLLLACTYEGIVGIGSFVTSAWVTLRASDGIVLSAQNIPNANLDINGLTGGNNSLRDILTETGGTFIAINPISRSGFSDPIPTVTNLIRVDINTSLVTRWRRFATGNDTVYSRMIRMNSGNLMLLGGSPTGGAAMLLDPDWNIITRSNNLAGTQFEFSEGRPGESSFYVFGFDALHKYDEFLGPAYGLHVLSGGGASFQSRAGRTIDPVNEWMVNSGDQSGLFVRGIEFSAPVQNYSIPGYGALEITSVPKTLAHQVPAPNDMQVEDFTPPLAVPIVVTATPVSLPLSNASTDLIWTLFRDFEGRGTLSPWPSSRNTPDPSEALDSLGAEVVLHLPLTGPDNARAIVDTSGEDHVIEVNGLARLRTSTSPFADSSLQLDAGTRSFINVKRKPSLTLLLADFAVECYVLIPTLALNNSPVLWDTGPVDVTNPTRLRWILLSDGRMQLSGVTPAFTVTTTAAIPASTWIHIAISRVDGIFRFYIAGQADAASYRANTNLPFDGCTIGRDSQTLGAATARVFLRDFRITRNQPRYFRSFTPRSIPIVSAALPTPPSDPGHGQTILLLPLDGTRGAVTDFSVNDFVPTISGTFVQDYAVPLFNRATALVAGGTALDFVNSDIFDLPGDFTVELFTFLPTAAGTSGSRGLLSRAPTVAGGLRLFCSLVTNEVTFGVSTPEVFISCGVLTRDVWHYIAVSRTGDTISTYLDGNLVSTVVNTYVLDNAASLRIFDGGAGTSLWNGRLAQLRIKKDVGLYSGATIPVPTEPWPLY